MIEINPNGRKLALTVKRYCFVTDYKNKLIEHASYPISVDFNFPSTTNGRKRDLCKKVQGGGDIAELNTGTALFILLLLCYYVVVFFRVGKN